MDIENDDAMERHLDEQHEQEYGWDFDNGFGQDETDPDPCPEPEEEGGYSDRYGDW